MVLEVELVAVELAGTPGEEPLSALALAIQHHCPLSCRQYLDEEEE
jgi:hypothetical protein